MQLTAISWAFFGLGVALLLSVLAAWGVYLVWRRTASRRQRGDRIFATSGYTFVALIAGAILVGTITSGGVKAHAIQRDLQTQGYSVVNIETDDNTAMIMMDGYPREVQVIKSGNTWKPALSCPILPSGKIVNQLPACTVVHDRS